jgi:fused signal recognition particle receptor
LDITAAPSVVLVVGVNGTGKTTTIGKLAHRLHAGGKKVMLAAGDTFRAAASEQLSIWGERAGIPVIKHKEGADPGAVVFDAVSAARARDVDVLIVDTAGRLHTKSNLMEELKKVKRILARELPGAPHETLLVLDGNTGQNALVQAKMFNEAVGVTGIVLTKLDGTSKGGIVFAINKELQIPVKFVGIGEAIEDLREFDPKEFVDALL